MTDVPVTIWWEECRRNGSYAGRQSQSAGVDNVYFTVPAGVAYGCQVPVVISGRGSRGEYDDDRGDCRWVVVPVVFGVGSMRDER